MPEHADSLAPPRRDLLNPDHVVPLSPPARPPFAHYASHSELPATPSTPYPAGQPPQRSSPAFVTRYDGLPPFLTLPYRLLLTLLTPAVIPLILTIAHLIANRSSTSSLAAALKASVLSACSGLAKGAASLQTLPRYLAMQTNDEVVRATQASILFIGIGLMNCVTIVEKVVGFMVDTYRSMLLCTIELAVRGSLEVVIEAVRTISSGVTTSLNAVRASIQDDLKGANDLIQSAANSVNTVAKTFGYSVSIPQITIPSLNALQNVTVPTGFQDSLVKLNASIPSLAALKDKMTDIIEIPFEALKKEMNATRLEMVASFNSSILPVPSLSSLSANQAASMEHELCSGLDTSLIDDTAQALHKLSDVAIGLMFSLLFLVWGALMFWEWRRWRAMKGTVEAVEAEWVKDGPQDAWRVVSIVENPMLERYGNPILRRITKKERTRNNIRWYLSYLSHPTCLALLFIAALGFLSLQFQLVALDAIKSHAKENANSTVTASTNDLTAKLNAMAFNSSREYALEFNQAVAKYQARIDDELFGPWLNTTAVVLNNTLVTFYADIETALNTTFGGTVLYSPINTFMYCILGSKIDNLEQALTWIKENAKITLPTLPNDILMLSNASMNELATPVAAAAVGSSTDSSDTGAVGGLIEHFEDALRVERNFYGILLGVWLAFALVGLIVVIWHSGGKDTYSSWKGGHGDGNEGPSGGATTGHAQQPQGSFWSFGKTPIADQYADSEKQFRGTVPANPPPHIRETGDTDSFFNYSVRGGGRRPRPESARQSSVRQSIASLVGPAQAFLRLGLGRQPTLDTDRLVERGVSSERYNEKAPAVAEREEAAQTPSPFWVKRFMGGSGAKSVFPSRGQKLGAQLERNASMKSEGSFGASQPSCATQPWASWRGASGSAEHLRDSAHDEEEQAGGRRPTVWDMMGARDDDSRYPALGPPIKVNENDSRALTQPWSKPLHSLPRKAPATYPRPLSRAPTIPEGAHIAPLNPFGDAPPLPGMHDSEHLWDSRSIDVRTPVRGSHYQYDYDSEYNYSSPESQRRTDQRAQDSYADMDRSLAPHDQIERGRTISTAAPRSLSIASYAHSDAEVSTAHMASRAPQQPTGPGTAALSSVLADMRAKQQAQASAGRRRSVDPFNSVLDHSSARR